MAEDKDAKIEEVEVPQDDKKTAKKTKTSKNKTETVGAKIVPDPVSKRWLVKNTTRTNGQFYLKGEFVNVAPGKYMVCEDEPSRPTRELRVTEIKRS